ncbi:hypothetical protein PS865_04454 [Pseudomonas fluorescens]|uniref:fimbrial protein n=1 Tax=Pseudomonas fluorescens TaxID=294 RepID=UPI00124121CC|nr:fimbrial protein [Pseudomonas fluorescens]VVP32876.1 hypothetical protein PS865_04454 [Pseudomonas fluorescens]
MKNFIFTTANTARVGLLASALLGASYSYADVRNNECRTNQSGGMGSSVTTIILDSMRPYYSVPVGEVLGQGRVQDQVQCYDVSETALFVVQMIPASSAVLGDEICQTPLDGVGIRFRAWTGTPIRCDGWSDILSINNPVSNRVYPYLVPNAIEFVRTKSVTSLTPGLHNLSLPASTQINSYRPGLTGGERWGSYNFKATNQLLVSTCIFAKPTTTVDFGKLNFSDITTKSVDFSIDLGTCGDASAAAAFNDIAKIQFSSAQLRQDGGLDNSNCTGCAKGVAIELTTGRGVRVPLNANYEMVNGDFSINGETITHRFKAKLKQTATPMTGGKIDSMVTITLSSI